MRDRVPSFPGRVTLTPVSGQANTYDMVRADAPVEAGTPLNKSTLMPDALATALGLNPATATPAEGIAKVHQLAAASMQAVYGSYTGSLDAGVASTKTITLGFKPRLVFIYSYFGRLNEVRTCMLYQQISTAASESFNVQYDGDRAVNSARISAVSFSETGVTFSANQAYFGMNCREVTYYYIALK